MEILKKYRVFTKKKKSWPDFKLEKHYFPFQKIIFLFEN